MKRHVSGIVGLASILFAIAAPVTYGQADPARQSATAVPADNSKANKLDGSNHTATADSQKENGSDRDIIRRIRKSVVADKSLSTYAHNIKIVSVDGRVTLNGVVRSDAEKSTLEQKAVAVAGKDQIVNDLKIVAAN